MVPWGGVSCCLSAAALYLLGKSSGRDAEEVKSATRVNQLKDLAQLLDTASKVTVSGRVASETPIDCEYSSLQGVIVEQTEELRFSKLNDGWPWSSWKEDSSMMRAMSKEVPWYLDDGTSHVHVVGARGATGLVLTIGSEVFEESDRSLLDRAVDYLDGLKIRGVMRIERVLPTGTPLTVVGEAVKDDVGTIRIQRPHEGPFYVSPETIDQLIARLGKWAGWYKFASIGFSVFGVYLIAKHAFEYIMDRRRHWELRKRIRDAEAERPGQDNEGSNGDAESGSDSAERDRVTPDQSE